MRKKVGRIENISFHELKIETIKAKVDTGAYGVALHVDNIRQEDGKLYFSSDGHPSLGGLDLFVASRNENDIIIEHLG